MIFINQLFDIGIEMDEIIQFSFYPQIDEKELLVLDYYGEKNYGSSNFTDKIDRHR